MRKIFYSLLIAFATKFANAQAKISIDSVGIHMGQVVQVCAKVYGVKALDKITFINLGARYPNSPLTVVIYAKDLPNFKSTPAELYIDNKFVLPEAWLSIKANHKS